VRVEEGGESARCHMFRPYSSAHEKPTKLLVSSVKISGSGKEYYYMTRCSQ